MIVSEDTLKNETRRNDVALTRFLCHPPDAAWCSSGGISNSWIEIVLDHPVDLYGMIAQRHPTDIMNFISGYTVRYKETDGGIFRYITNRAGAARRVRRFCF